MGPCFPLDFRRTLGFAWKACKVYEKLCADAGAAYGLTQNEIDVLLFLFHQPELNTAGEVARYRHISKSLVSKSVNDLVERGYLTARKDVEDRRNWRLTIEPQAGQAMEELLAAQRRFQAILVGSIEPAELEAFLGTLKKLSDVFDSFL